MDSRGRQRLRGGGWCHQNAWKGTSNGCERGRGTGATSSRPWAKAVVAEDVVSQEMLRSDFEVTAECEGWNDDGNKAPQRVEGWGCVIFERNLEVPRRCPHPIDDKNQFLTSGASGV